MTLAIGTALQNGTYVIDALDHEDTIGPVYLATHIPTGQWRLVRVLGSRHPQMIPSADQRAAFYETLTAIANLDHPLLSVRLHGFDEEGVCYQTLTQPPGLPLTHRVSPQSPSHSLGIIRQLADALKTLRPLGWAGLTITPDQLWQAAETNQLSFIGFDLPAAGPDSSTHESQVVQGLSFLLYFLLTGQRAEATRASLAIDLRHRLPELPTCIDTALEQGSQATTTVDSMDLETWLALLPDGDSLPATPRLVQTPSPRATTVVATPPPQPVAAPTGPRATRLPSRPVTTSTPNPPSSRSRLATWALLGTSVVAGLSGITFGLQARLQLSDAASPVRLNPNQSFPPLPDWSGGRSADWSAPTGRQPTRPDYGSSPPAPTPSAQELEQPTTPAAQSAPAINTPTPESVPADTLNSDFGEEPDPSNSDFAPVPLPPPRSSEPIEPPGAVLPPTPSAAPTPISPEPNLAPPPVAPAPLAPIQAPPPAPLTSS
jgi:hypothetical protein